MNKTVRVENVIQLDPVDFSRVKNAKSFVRKGYWFITVPVIKFINSETQEVFEVIVQSLGYGYTLETLTTNPWTHSIVTDLGFSSSILETPQGIEVSCPELIEYFTRLESDMKPTDRVTILCFEKRINDAKTVELA